MKVLVTGSRDWIDRHTIFRALMGFPPGTVLINGGCKGVDQLSTDVAKELNFTVKEYLADWSEGKKAGPLRNQDMLDLEDPDIVIAFHENIEESKGTLDMCKKARKAKVPIILIERGDNETDEPKHATG